MEAPPNIKENKPKLKAPKVAPAIEIKSKKMKESKHEVKQEMSIQEHPGKIPMGARIHLEVGHTMYTMCKKTSKLCHHCLNIYKEVAPISEEVEINKNKLKVKA